MLDRVSEPRDSCALDIDTGYKASREPPKASLSEVLMRRTAVSDRMIGIVNTHSLKAVLSWKAKSVLKEGVVCCGDIDCCR